MKIPGVAWRAMSAYDLPAVAEIAGAVHPKFPEAPEVLAERHSLYHNGAYLLEIGERPAGYILSHPWRFGALPALNSLLGALPADPDTYYLHDLALLPVARRIGAGGMMVEALTRHAEARGLRQMSLVAVHGSASFWRRHDFLPVDVPERAGKLLSYDADALYMVRRLDPPGD